MSKRRNDAEIGPLTIPEFHKKLDEISRAHRRYENFRSFMEAAYCAIAKLTAPDAARADALEARYMAVVQRHQDDKDAMGRMAHLLARLELTIPDYKGDFLGEAYMQAEFGDEYRGQFFTPYAISSLIARMNVSRESVEAALAEGRPLTLCEPAAGAGCMVIAVADHLKELGFDLQRTLFATLIDVDALAYQMAFLQMSLKDIPAVCVHGDSIALTERECAFTIAGAIQQGLPVWRVGQSPPHTHAPAETRLSDVEAGASPAAVAPLGADDGADAAATAESEVDTEFRLELSASGDLAENGAAHQGAQARRRGIPAQANDALARARDRIALRLREGHTAPPPEAGGGLFADEITRPEVLRPPRPRR